MRYFFFLSLICNLAFGRNHFSPKGPTSIWDTSTAAGILNGSGNWTSTSELWTYENGGDNSPFCLGCNVSFGRAGSTGNAGTVTITGTQPINNMTFGPVAGGNYTLTGGTILCVNTPSCTYDVNISATIASVLSGSKTLIKTGTGTLTLSGVNTTTGDLTINGGGITINSDMAALAFSRVSLAAGTTLNFALNPGTWVSTGKIISGSGTINLNANVGINNLNFNTDSNSMVTMGAGTTIDNNTGSFPFQNFAGTLNILGSFTNGDTIISCKGITGNGVLNHTTNNVTYYIYGPGTSTFSGTSADMRNISFFNVATGVTQALNGALAGTGGITKQGGGILSLSGANTYSDPTIVDGGNLTLNPGGLLSNTSSITINNGGTMQFSGNANSDTIGSASKPINVNAGSTLSVTTTHSMGYTALNNYANITINGGTFNLTASQYIGTLTLTNATVSGTGAVQFFYTVPTAIDTISNSTISSPMNINSSTSPQTINVRAGATLSVTGNIGFNSNGSAAITKSGTGILIFSGNNTYTANTTVAAGTLQLGNGVSTNNIIPAANLITNNATLIYNTPSSITHSGVISGTGSFTKQGTGVLNLTGANTYTGATSVTGGTLYYDNASTSIGPTSGINLNGGNVTFSNGADTTYSRSLTWSGTGGILNITQPDFGHTFTITGNWILNGAASISSNKGSAGRININGIISGASPLSYIGNTWTWVNGNNTYTGGTILNSGAYVTCGHLRAFGTGTVTVNTGATLNRNACGMTNTIVNNGGTVNP